MAKPTNLLKTDFGYCFRMIVPADLREVIGQREIRYSLKERKAATAKRKARQLTRQVKQMFASLRVEEAPEKLDQKKLQDRLRIMIKETVEEIADDRITHPFKSIPEVRDYLDVVAFRLHDYREALSIGDYREVPESQVQGMAEGLGLGEVKKGSEDYNRIAANLLRSHIAILEADERITTGDFPYSLQEKVREAKVKEKQQNGATLGEVAADYWEERQPNWKPRTEKEYKLYHSTLLDYFTPEAVLHELDYNSGREYRKHLQAKLTPAGKPMSETRRNLYLGYAKSVWSYAIRLHHVSENIMDGLQTKRKKKRADLERSAYSPDNLKTLFVSSPEYTGKIKRADYFFIPLISLWSGMRVEEICQLAVDNIVERDGLPCFDINERDGRSVKTSEQRIIPIHDRLIEIGFLDYVQIVKDSGSSRLFPKLKKQNEHYSHALSKWFGKFKTRSGFTKAHTFHSLRHTAATELSRAGVDDMTVSRILGHAQEGMTKKRYIKTQPVKDLKAALDRLDYEFPTDHLKGAWLTKDI